MDIDKELVRALVPESVIDALYSDAVSPAAQELGKLGLGLRLVS